MSSPAESAPASESPSSTPSPLPSSGGVYFVPKGAQDAYAAIKLVCIGDSMSATAQLLDSTYSVTIKPTDHSRADIFFTKGDTSAEYLYLCDNGTIRGGRVPSGPESR